MKKITQNMLIHAILFLFAFSTYQVHAENSDWVLAATVNTSNFEVKQSSVTKIQNSLVFDAYWTIQSGVGAGVRSLDRYNVSCNGKSAAQLSGVPIQITELKDRTRWLDEKDTTILASKNSLTVDTEFSSDYWFMTKIFKTKIQSWCKDSPKALKNIEASIASGNTNDGKIETNTVLLNTIKGFSKHREIWTASYFVNVIPILYTDPATGEKTQFKLNDKPQFEKSPNGKVNSRIRYRLRCDENKIAMTQSVIYLKNGVVSESQSLTEAQINSNWSDVVPGSTGESILVFVCAL